MATKRTIKKQGTKRDVPQIMNFFQVNGVSYALGDIRKADFANLSDPKASINSLQAWAVQLNNILRGFAQS